MGFAESKLRGWRRVYDDGTVVGLPQCSSPQPVQWCAHNAYCPGHCRCACHSHIVAVTRARHHCHHRRHAQQCCHTCLCKDIPPATLAAIAQQQQQHQRQVIQQMQQQRPCVQSITTSAQPQAQVLQQQQSQTPLMLLPAPTCNVSATTVQRALATDACAAQSTTACLRGSDNNNATTTTTTIVPMLQVAPTTQQQPQQASTTQLSPHAPLSPPAAATSIRRSCRAPPPPSLSPSQIQLLCRRARSQRQQQQHEQERRRRRRRRHCVAPTPAYEYSGRDAYTRDDNDDDDVNTSYGSCSISIDVDRSPNRYSPRRDSSACSLWCSDRHDDDSYASLRPPPPRARPPRSRSRHGDGRDDDDDDHAPALNHLSPVRSPLVQWRDTLPPQPRQPRTPLRPHRRRRSGSSISNSYSRSRSSGSRCSSYNNNNTSSSRYATTTMMRTTDDIDDIDSSSCRSTAATTTTTTWSWWVSQVRRGAVTRDRHRMARLCNMRNSLLRQHTALCGDSDSDDDDDDATRRDSRRVELDVSYCSLDAATAPRVLARLLAASRALHELRWVTVLCLSGNDLGHDGLVELFATLSRAQATRSHDDDDDDDGDDDDGDGGRRSSGQRGRCTDGECDAVLPALRVLHMASMHLTSDDVAVLAALLFAHDANATRRRSSDDSDDARIAGAVARDVTLPPRWRQQLQQQHRQRRRRRALFPRLRVLDLAGNAGIGNAGVCELLRSLLASHDRRRTLDELDLSCCGLDAAVLPLLYEYRSKVARAWRRPAWAATVVLVQRVVLTGNRIDRTLSPTACSRLDRAADVQLVY